MKNPCFHPRRPLLGLTLALLLGLVLAAPSTAQTAPGIGTYKISNVFDVETRSAIARTGANIFEVGRDYVLVEATTREARALKRLGLKLADFQTPADFREAFPAADSAYHDYAEMVAELEQAAFDHSAILSLSSLGLAYEGRTLWASGRPPARPGPLQERLEAVATGSPAPRARAHHPLIYAEGWNALFVYGGYTNDAVTGTGLFTPENYLGDLWRFDLDGDLGTARLRRGRRTGPPRQREADRR